MEFKDYYATLGVEPSAREAEIKTYRRLARKYHPDVSKEAGAEDKFKAVNEAYEALRDPEKRAAYDQLRAQGYRPGEEFNVPPNYGGAEASISRKCSVAVAPTAASATSKACSRASARAGGPGFSSQGHAPNRDTRAKLSVPLEAASDSLRITVNGKQLDVRVPKGIRPGQVIRLAGQGNHGGNLLLEVEYAAPAVRSRWPQHPLYAAAHAVAGRAEAPASACRPWAARWN